MIRPARHARPPQPQCPLAGGPGCEARHSLGASLCLRAVIEEVLEMAQTSRYPRAVRQLDSSRRLASTIGDWGRFPPHNVYVRELLRAYGHLMGFLKKLNFDALLLPE